MNADRDRDRDRGRGQRQGPVASDAGFTLLETLMSIFVVSVVMTALTTFYVNAQMVTNRQSGVQTATQIAAAAVGQARSIRGSGLAAGRDQTSSHAQWLSPVGGVAPYLVDMTEAYDATAGTGAGAVAVLPTVAQPIVMNGLTFKRYWYLGKCWQPLTWSTAAGGACVKTQTTGWVEFFRVVIAVTWTDSSCAGSACSYVTSTLISSGSQEPLFNANDSAQPPVAVNPGTQSGYVDAAATLQLTYTGGAAPLSWIFAGLPSGLTGASNGLVSGAPNTVGSYSVTATVTDAFGLSNAATFTWTVKPLTYPMQVALDTPFAYYRGEEAASAAANPSAPDSSTNNRTGTYTGSTNGPATWWQLNAGSGTTATDSAGAANHGTLTNGPGWVTGTSGTGLSFNGSNTSVQGTAAAVHTNKDFSTTAWAYLTSTAGGVNRAVVSQNGGTSFGFALRYDTASGKWAFAMNNTDSTGPAVSQVLSTATAATGRWVHLAGVYNATSGNLSLYVDGLAQGSAARTGSWDAQGKLQAGAEQRDGTAVTDVLNGRIDDVRVYQRTLTAAEIRTLAVDNALLQYDFSEGSGTTTADAAGLDDTGTLISSVGWAGAGNGHAGNALTFAGSTSTYVSSAFNPIHTDADYTASAWVYLTSTSTDRAVMGLNGTAASPFSLAYASAYGRWVFAASWSDTNSATLDVVPSVAAPTLNAWVHLTGVYNATAGTIALYVNGTLQGTAAHTAAHAWDTTGTLEVGRTRLNSAATAPWSGRIDSVRLYQRALNATDIAALVAETAPASVVSVPVVTAGLPGALQGSGAGLQASTALAYAGVGNGYYPTAVNNPNTFTLECWFKTAGTTGGVLIGFNLFATGVVDTSTDRNLYIDSGGQLSFGTYPGTTKQVRSPLAYNDGLWHHAAASLGPGGQKLYVDGALVTSISNTTGQNFTGYWRWGGLYLGATWANRPTNTFFTGMLDEVAIYSTQLTDARILAHYQSNQ